MAKKKTAKGLPEASAQEQKQAVLNGLSEAVLGFSPGSYGTELSQLDTIFKNERWYLISNMRQILSQVYVEHGLIQTVVDVPVEDAFRGGLKITSQQLDPDQVQDLQIYLEREDIISGVLGQSNKWNRLFGGAGILILIGDQDPMAPLNLSAIKEETDVQFRAVDMWELFWDKQSTDSYDATIQEQSFEFYSYYGKKVHKSRVIKMVGMKPPSFIRARLRGWGVSVVECLVQSLNQYLKEKNLTFEVLDEFKLDVFKLKNLTSTLMAAEGETKVRRRVALANQQKNFQHAIVLDSEDDYGQKQLTFSGLADVMREIRIQIACDLRMPLTKIFGISASGFNSGEDDIENYNAMIESSIRSRAKYQALQLIEIICQKKFGFIPDDLKVEFAPLRILSAEQEENVKTQKYNRLLAARQAGEITAKEFRDACNQENLLSIQLETDDSVMRELEEETDEADEAEEDAEVEHDTDTKRSARAKSVERRQGKEKKAGAEKPGSEKAEKVTRERSE